MEKNESCQPQRGDKSGMHHLIKYNVGVKIEEFNGPVAQGFLLSPIGENLEPSEVASSLSFVFGIVAN